jgi:hypothetical protein
MEGGSYLSLDIKDENTGEKTTKRKTMKEQKYRDAEIFFSPGFVNFF